MTLAQQVHAKFAFMGIASVERPLSDASGQGNLVHTYRIDAMRGKEAPRNFQNALAMLGCIAPFGAPVRLEQR